MIRIKNGDLLKAPEDILVHQVNVQGVMGGGIAKQIATQYPRTEAQYKKFCTNRKNDYGLLKGRVDMSKEQGKYIANMFSQKSNFDTDYKAMEEGLIKIRNYAINRNLSVAMPFKIGCGIANGDWELVLDVINKVFKDYEVTLYRLD